MADRIAGVAGMGWGTESEEGGGGYGWRGLRVGEEVLDVLGHFVGEAGTGFAGVPGDVG